MIAVRLNAPRTLTLEDVPEPGEPSADSATIASTLSLISSGTERRIYQGLPVPAIVDTGFSERLRFAGSPTDDISAYRVTPAGGSRSPSYPTTLGYNSVGIVEAVGAEATMLHPGQRVMTIAPHRQRFELPEWQAVAIPDVVNTEDAVFSYLATLGLCAARRLRLEPGSNVAVIGLGPVGSATARLLAACGARVAGIDPDSSRRTINSSWLTAVLDPSEPGFAQALESVFWPEPVDCVIETAGTGASLSDAARIVHRRGRVAVIALHPEATPGGDFGDLFHEKECELISSANDRLLDPRSNIERFTLFRNVRFVLDLIASGRVSFGDLLTRRFPATDAAAAYELACGQPRLDVLGVGLDWPAQNHPQITTKEG